MRLLDTCFLIDLQREFRSGQDGPVKAYLQANAAERFAISVVSVTEFLEGFADPAAGEALLRPYCWLPVIPEVAREAARIRRQLRMEGRLIGDFDILIAATALVGGMELGTNNQQHFGRIEGLQIVDYTALSPP
jgi:predicted nucleic acid-binding protein